MLYEKYFIKTLIQMRLEMVFISEQLLYVENECKENQWTYLSNKFLQKIKITKV
jgi:hypothetical protein